MTPVCYLQIEQAVQRIMLNEVNPEIELTQPMIYQIRIKGHLGSQWTDWFDGVIITLEDNGNTLLIGPALDQAALHGLLRKVRDLGMPLLSVVSLESECSNTTTSYHNQEK